MDLDRRIVLAALAGAAGASSLPHQSAAAAAKAPPPAAQDEDYAHPFNNDPNRHDDVALLVFNNMTVLDMVGPYNFLSYLNNTKIHLITNRPDLSLVHSDAGMGVQPTTTMADCPRDLALLLIPGGTGGILASARDKAVLEFVRDRAGRARYVASVCTGSLLLGAAGLLRGKRATTHWSKMDVLPKLGAIPVQQRVVEDGNLITAAGISSGLDAGALLVERLRGRPLAEAATLMSQYAPEPPFPGGNPERARPEILAAATQDLQKGTDLAMALRPVTDLSSL